MTSPTYGSLFSGVGGFDMGFDRAGYRCVFQVEWDDHCQQTLAHHWPDVPRWSDVKDVNGAELPPCDVLTFGSPCQDLSVAGRRAGLDGGRSSMFHEAIRIVKEMRYATQTYPRVIIWENVAGALESNRGADFGSVLDQMADIGALVLEWNVLDACHWLPQRRRRIFLIAILDPAVAERDRGEILPIRSGDQRYSAETATGMVAFYRTHGKRDTAQLGISPTLKAVSQICIASADDPPRGLTPIEHERLMGWPDNHTLYRADGKTNSDSTRYKMCGNGVATPVAYWVAEQLLALLEIRD
jgi:DNA (cytosine-5)-methyltransferase 1